MTTPTGGERTDAQTVTDPSQTTGQKPSATAQPWQIQNRETPVTERERMLAELDANIERERTAATEEFLRSADPRAAAMFAEANPGAAKLPISTDVGTSGAPATSPGAKEGAGAGGDKAAAVAVQPGGKDPLADWIVLRDGKPMLRAVIDGKERELPLEQARATIQKNLAADARLQDAARRKQELDAREAALNQREAARRAPAKAVATPLPVTDTDLDNEARGLVKALLTEPEDKAAAKVAAVLKKVRQAPVAPIDPDAIANKAATVAVSKIAERDMNRALTEGLRSYQDTYPSIAGDSDLNALADRKTTTIATEHPEWTPSQIMLEAGRQVDEWVKGLGGSPAPQPPKDPVVKLSEARQQRKDDLVPMPTARTDAGEAPPKGDEETTAGGYLAELRKARGQPN